MPEAAQPAAPPAPGRLLALTDQCVQCGLCLPACPTYRFDPIETESPRGRIALVRAWELATVPATSIGDTHLDHCLGCRRCEVVCPAGVQYGPLLVAARSRQRDRRVPDWKQRSAEWLSARPRLLERLLGLYRGLFPLLPAAWRPLPRPPATVTLPLSQPAGVGLFLGCVARPYETALQTAVLRLGSALGIAIALPGRQTCCGSLHAHAGNTAMTATLAKANHAAFANATTVLTLASGCHESVAQALPTTTTQDALDFFARHSEALGFRASRERVALHLPCTQRNVVKSDDATRALLARVPGLEIIELDAGFGCCGAAGTQMVTEPARAAAYRQPLLDQLAATGATRLLSANIGCRLHFGNGTQVPVQHPLEFLAEHLDA